MGSLVVSIDECGEAKPAKGQIGDDDEDLGSENSDDEHHWGLAEPVHGLGLDR